MESSQTYSTVNPFFSWSLNNQDPFGDSFGDTLYQGIKAREDSRLDIVPGRKWGNRMRLAQERGVGNIECQVLERGEDKEETKMEI